MPGVSDPDHDPGADGVEPDPSNGKFSLHPSHPATESAHVFLDQKSVRGEDSIAQEPDALIARKYYALVLVDLKTQRLQESLDLQAHLVKTPLVVGKNEKIINVADIAQPETFGDEVIERIEVDVCEELARLVAQRQTPAPLRGRFRSIRSPSTKRWLRGNLLVWLHDQRIRS